MYQHVDDTDDIDAIGFENKIALISSTLIVNSINYKFVAINFMLKFDKTLK